MPHTLTRYDDLRVGQQARVSKTVTEADISHFVAICGDTNPLHVDRKFARRTFFGRRVAHGMLTASLFSHLVGMCLPGTGAIYRSQTLEFLRPVHIGDTVTAALEITAIDPRRERIDLQGEILNRHNETVVRGKAVVTLLRGLSRRDQA